MRDKASKNPNYDGWQSSVVSMVYKCFDKKPSATRTQSENIATQNIFAGGAIKNEIISNKALGKQLQKPIIRKFEKI